MNDERRREGQRGRTWKHLWPCWRWYWRRWATQTHPRIHQKRTADWNRQSLNSWEKAMITVIYKKGTWQVQRTTGRSVVFHSFTNSSARCYTTGCTPCLIGTSVPTRQDSEKTFQTTDHLMTYKLISQKSREWRTDMRVAAIGLLKNVLRPACHRLTDVESDEFGIARGTKHGEPLSSLLFNSVLQSSMEKDVEIWKESAWEQKQVDPLSSLLFKSVLRTAMEKGMETWNEKGLGIKLSGEKRDCILNLRFADDLLMMANSLKQLKKWSRTSKKCGKRRDSKSTQAKP